MAGVQAYSADDAYRGGEFTGSKTGRVPGCIVTSDGLACFAGVTDAGCEHQAVIVGTRKAERLAAIQLGEYRLE